MKSVNYGDLVEVKTIRDVITTVTIWYLSVFLPFTRHMSSADYKTAALSSIFIKASVIATEANKSAILLVNQLSAG